MSPFFWGAGVGFVAGVIAGRMYWNTAISYGKRVVTAAAGDVDKVEKWLRSLI